MIDAELSEAMLHVDRCIEAYVSRCRTRIPAFVSRIPLEQTWALQRPTLLRIWFAPLNSAWAIPYLTLKKIAAGLEALGVSAAARVMQSVPSGIRDQATSARSRPSSAEAFLEWDLSGDPTSLPHGLLGSEAAPSAADVRPQSAAGDRWLLADHPGELLVGQGTRVECGRHTTHSGLRVAAAGERVAQPRGDRQSPGTAERPRPGRLEVFSRPAGRFRLLYRLPARGESN